MAESKKEIVVVEEMNTDKSNLTDKLAGWKTSEFWLTLLTVGFSLFYLFKGRAGDMTEAGPLIQQTSESIAILVANITVIFRYIKSRENIKTTTIEQEVKLQQTNIISNKSGENKGEVTTTKSI